MKNRAVAVTAILALLAAAGCRRGVSPAVAPALAPVTVEYEMAVVPEKKILRVEGHVRGLDHEDVDGWGNPTGRPDTYGAPEIIPDTVDAVPGGVRFAYTVRVPEKEQLNSTEPALDTERLRAWGWHLFATPILTRAPERVIVRIDAPAGWAVATSLGERRGPLELPTLEDVRGLAVFAGNMGNILTSSFRAAGIPVHLAVRRGHPVPDSVLERALASVLRVAVRRFGVNPFERLMIGLDLLKGRPTFAPGNNVTTPALHSILLLNGDNVASEVGFFPTLAHEALHAWIPDLFGAEAEVKRELGGFFTEGFTNYLGYKVAREAGLLSEEKLAWILSNALVEYRYMAGPGREKYGHMLDYHQGMVTAWVLDSELLRVTDGRYGIWDLLRRLAQRYAGGGLTRERFAAAVAALGGQRLGGLYDELTGTQEAIDVAARLKGAGIQFHFGPDPRADLRKFRATGEPVVNFEPANAEERRFLRLLLPAAPR